MSNKYSRLKDAILNGKLFDFIVEEGHDFSKSELIDILKETAYAAELMSKHYNSGFTYESFCEVLINNLEENTAVLDEE